MAPRFNLLFIYTDEQRADTLAAYGNTRIHTPNLDRLAAESTVFDNAYVTQPVCTPSRSSLLTGLWPHTNGCTQNNAPLRPDTPCFPEMLSRRYSTAHFGKWHLGDEIFPQHGFAEWRGLEDLYAKHYSPGRDRDARGHYHHWLTARGMRPKDGSVFGREETSKYPEELSRPAFLAGEAAGYIRGHRKDPFVLFVNFLEPHMPFNGPRDGQYDPASVPLPSNHGDRPDATCHLKNRALNHRYEKGGFGWDRLDSEEGWRNLIARYWGLVSEVDTHVGAILGALEDGGLADRTVVVFTSDHGDMMGSHRLVAKSVCYEEAVRVPLMVRMPGQRRGLRVPGRTSQIDLVPTLLELMGEPATVRLQGRSVAPLVTGAAERPAGGDDVFFEWNGPNNGLGDVLNRVSIPRELEGFAPADELKAAFSDPIRSIVTQDGWKMNFSPLGMHELFDLSKDPGEKRNLAREAQSAPLMRDLRERILRWQERTEDAVKLPDIPDAPA